MATARKNVDVVLLCFVAKRKTVTDDRYAGCKPTGRSRIFPRMLFVGERGQNGSEVSGLLGG